MTESETPSSTKWKIYCEKREATEDRRKDAIRDANRLFEAEEMSAWRDYNKALTETPE